MNDMNNSHFTSVVEQSWLDSVSQQEVTSEPTKDSPWPFPQILPSSQNDDVQPIPCGQPDPGLPLPPVLARLKKHANLFNSPRLASAHTVHNADAYNDCSCTVTSAINMGMSNGAGMGGTLALAAAGAIFDHSELDTCTAFYVNYVKSWTPW